METKKLSKQVLTTGLFISLFVSLGVYSGIRNANDDIFQDMELDIIQDEVQVYRDTNGVPTIIGKNLNDIAFVQGYEFARDRTFQLEIYHAMINSKLSTIFGIDLLEADVFTKTLDFKKVGERAESKLDPFYRNIVDSYVKGINLFYEQHIFNLSWEFQVLGLEPSEWSISDSLSMQAILAFNFNFESFANELNRLTAVKQIGINGTLELFPMQITDAITSLLSSNNSYTSLLSSYEDPFSQLFETQNFKSMSASNWVVGGTMSKTGNSTMVNAPNMRLRIPSFWYQINLQLSDKSLTVQGFAVPGLPLVLVGHNQLLSWGIGESNIDTLDLQFVTSNATHYYQAGIWKKFTVVSNEFPIAGIPTVVRDIYSTELGPILNVSDGWYSVKWALLEDQSRDKMFESIYKLNTANSIAEAHEALFYLTSPSINFILAQTDGQLGFQSTGLIPVREANHGYIPINGSIYDSVWTDFIDYEKMAYIENSAEPFLVNGNISLQAETSSYYLETRIPNYRALRIAEILISSITTDGITIKEVENIQKDILNIVAEPMLSALLGPMISEIELQSRDELKPLANSLNSWDFRMGYDSSSATIFEIFRMYLNREVYGDELGVSFANRLVDTNVPHLIRLLSNVSGNDWFDDLSTVNVTENGVDIAIRALQLTKDYLTELAGPNSESWSWGLFHQITYSHIMGNSVPLLGGLNLGPEAVNGSTFTVDSYPSSPFFEDSKISLKIIYGPSFRLITEVNENWENVIAMHAPGMSGHVTSEFYDNGYEDWINYEYQSWVFNPLEIILTQELVITYSPGD